MDWKNRRSSQSSWIVSTYQIVSISSVIQQHHFLLLKEIREYILPALRSLMNIRVTLWMGNPPHSTSERTVLLFSLTLREQRPKRQDLNPGPSHSESERPARSLKGTDFRWAPDWVRPQGFHYHWTGGRQLCVFLLSFRNPALIILFPQREVWRLPVACGLTKIGEDRKAAPPLSAPGWESSRLFPIWRE